MDRAWAKRHADLGRASGCESSSREGVSITWTWWTLNVSRMLQQEDGPAGRLPIAMWSFAGSAAHNMRYGTVRQYVFCSSRSSARAAARASSAVAAQDGLACCAAHVHLRTFLSRQMINAHRHGTSVERFAAHLLWACERRAVGHVATHRQLLLARRYITTSAEGARLCEPRQANLVLNGGMCCGSTVALARLVQGTIRPSPTLAQKVGLRAQARDAQSGSCLAARAGTRAEFRPSHPRATSMSSSLINCCTAPVPCCFVAWRLAAAPARTTSVPARCMLGAAQRRPQLAMIGALDEEIDAEGTSRAAAATARAAGRRVGRGRVISV